MVREGTIWLALPTATKEFIKYCDESSRTVIDVIEDHVHGAQLSYGRDASSLDGQIKASGSVGDDD